MDTILNAPMGADRVGELLDISVEADNVIALLDRHLPMQMPLRFYHPQTAQLGPGVFLREALGCLQGPVPANLTSPMLLLLCLRGLELCRLTRSVQCNLKLLLDCLVQRPLIGLEG